MIRIDCPKCGKGYDLPPEAVGKKATCKKCGERFVMSAPPAPVAVRAPLKPVEIPDQPPQFLPAVRPPGPISPRQADAHVSTVGVTPIPINVAPVVPAAGDFKDCPFCSEEVKSSAKKCKHCGETIDVTLRASEEAAREATAARRAAETRQPAVYMNAGGAASSSAAATAGGGCVGELGKMIVGGIMLVVLIYAGCRMTAPGY